MLNIIHTYIQASAEKALAKLEALNTSGATIRVCETVEEATKNADIICTLTPSLAKDPPILNASMVKAGAHINAVGACQPQFRELDVDIISASRLFVDTRAACLQEPGDLVIPFKEGKLQPEHILAEVGSVLTGKSEGRRGPDEITLFKSVGAAVEDLCATVVLFEKAEREPEGTFPTM